MEEEALKTLRIIFTIVSAIFIACVIPVGALVSWTWAIICAMGAILFFGLMMLCKQSQEEHDKRARHDDLSELDFGNDSKNSDCDKLKK